MQSLPSLIMQLWLMKKGNKMKKMKQIITLITEQIWTNRKMKAKKEKIIMKKKKKLIVISELIQTAE